MNKRTFWIILLVAAAFAAGYYYSAGKNNTPVDTVRSVAAAPRAAITSSPATKAPAAQQYVLNTNTKKFHKPSCSSVKQMKEKNKKVVTLSRQEIINMGYDPCGRCHP